MAFAVTTATTTGDSIIVVAPTADSLAKSTTMNRKKQQQQQIRLIDRHHAATSDDEKPCCTTILMKPPIAPNSRLYNRGNLNTTNNNYQRTRSKSGDEKQQDESADREVIKNRVHGTLHEEPADHQNHIVHNNHNHNHHHHEKYDDLPPSSPTKRVTFMERAATKFGQNHHSTDCSPSDDSRRATDSNIAKRRVRKSKTLDAVDLTRSNCEKQQFAPRSPVMGFFSQIRNVSNAAPWRSSASSSAITSAPPLAPPPPSASASSSSNSSAAAAAAVSSTSNSARPRSFALSLKTFANFLQQQDGGTATRKSSRQQTRNSTESKGKRKRTSSYSFRASNWLNISSSSKSKASPPPLMTQSQLSLKPIIRRRSISANDLNLLGASTSKSEHKISFDVPLPVNRNVFKDALTKYNCYDLMPQQGVVIGLDCRYTGRQALHTLTSNDIRVALLWDLTAGGMIGVLSGTDILQILADHATVTTTKKKSDARDDVSAAESETCQCESDDILTQSLEKTLFACPIAKKEGRRQAVTTVGCETSLSTALSLLIGNRYHRLPVINSRTGDVLYFLTKKLIFNFLMNHVANIFLPTPPVLWRTLDDTRLGTWRRRQDDGASCSGGSAADEDVFCADSGGIVCASITDTLSEAVGKLLRAGISALPVLDSEARLIGTLEKWDLVHCLASSADKNEDYGSITIQELARRQGIHESLITCHSDATLNDAVDLLLRADARRVHVVDEEDNKLKAVVTISDILAHLIEI